MSRVWRDNNKITVMTSWRCFARRGYSDHAQWDNPGLSQSTQWSKIKIAKLILPFSKKSLTPDIDSGGFPRRPVRFPPGVEQPWRCTPDVLRETWDHVVFPWELPPPGMKKSPFNPKSAEIFLDKPWRRKGFLNLKSSQMSQLALSASFEYLCYGSTPIVNILIFFSAGIDVRRQNLTSKDVWFWRIETLPALEGLIPD